MATVQEALAVAWQQHQAGHLQEAEERYRQIAKMAPTHPDVWYLLGVACQVQDKLGDAVASYEQALRCKPDFPEVLSNLGVAYKIMGRIDDAVTCYHKALKLRPGFPDAHNNLALALADQGKLGEAVTNYREAIRLKSDFPEAHYNLGKALQQQSDLLEAVACYRRALGIWPNYTDALNNLGVALQSLGKLDEAADCLQRALALDPRHADAHNNLGNVLKDQGKLDEAAYYYDQALQCRPGFDSAHSNLMACWNYDPSATPDALYAEHRRWAEMHARGTPESVHRNDRNPNRRLRIGYVSPDFYHHAVAHFLEPIFAHHEPGQVEIFSYAENSASDAVTARFQALSHAWRPTFGLSDAQVVDQIRADGIDILVDLAGHTAHSRLRVFAYKPAPVQITYLGYPNSTGLTTIDYRLTDAVADPPGESTRHTEELVRLPRAFCYTVLEKTPRITPLPALAAGHVTFGSLHNLAKLNGQVLDLWCAILRALPSSQLLVFRHLLQGSAHEYFRQQLFNRGIGPERFVLRHAIDGGSHLAVYSMVDLTLDAFPWNGHTTACESLWMGVPVIALYGNRYAGRMAADTLTAVGLPELIAETPEKYVAIARDWAGDLDRLARLRSELRERMTGSQLCDGRTFTQSLEDAYRALWRRWCARAGG